MAAARTQPKYGLKNSKPDCRFWAQGYCRNGDACRFLHREEYAGGNFKKRPHPVAQQQHQQHPTWYRSSHTSSYDPAWQTPSEDGQDLKQPPWVNYDSNGKSKNTYGGGGRFQNGGGFPSKDGGDKFQHGKAASGTGGNFGKISQTSWSNALTGRYVGKTEKISDALHPVVQQQLVQQQGESTATRGATTGAATRGGDSHTTWCDNHTWRDNHTGCDNHTWCDNTTWWGNNMWPPSKDGEYGGKFQNGKAAGTGGNLSNARTGRYVGKTEKISDALHSVVQQQHQQHQPHGQRGNGGDQTISQVGYHLVHHPKEGMDIIAASIMANEQTPEHCLDNLADTFCRQSPWNSFRRECLS